MKVKAKIKFNDLQDKTVRSKGEEFTVSKERGDHLVGIGFASEVKGSDVKESKEATQTKELKTKVKTKDLK